MPTSKCITAWTTPAIAQDVLQGGGVGLHAFAHGTTALLASIAELAPTAVVFDPGVAASAEHAATTVEEVRAKYPHLPIVVYGPLTRSLAQLVCDTAGKSRAPIVLLSATDGPPRLEHVVESLARLRATEQVLVGLADAIRRLPLGLQERVRDAFRRPQEYTTIDQLVHGSAVSRRHVYRHLKLAGFHAGKDLLIAARVAYAFEDLKDERLTLGEVSTRAGYQDHGTFSRHVRRVVGVLPRIVRSQWHVTEFVRHVCDAALGGRSGSPARLL